MRPTPISTFSVIAVLWTTALCANGQDDWKVPQEAAAQKNPIATSEASIRSGEAAYAKTCLSCHGKTGEGDGFAAGMLKRKPKSLAQVLAGQSDGEIFWKIRNGNPFMPASSAISEEETWHVINFVRTLAAADQPGAHPWASFPEGAWVDVHTDHEMVIGAGTEPTVWSSDSRMIVGSAGADAITIKHENSAREISEQALISIPALDAFPGVRALGQWPHDIFPFGPERESGVTPQDKQPIPQGVRTETVREEEVDVAGETKMAKVLKREWKTATDALTQAHVLTAWVVEGFELPVKWTHSVDGKPLSESLLEGKAEMVKVGDVSIPCVLTVTKKHLADGVIVKRRWSSRQVPGFLVKMESQMDTDMYSLTVSEWVTGFQATAAAVAQEAKFEGNPPGSRPALGFMPGYEADEDGLLVERVTPGGPADDAGIEDGDLIIEIDGDEVFGIEDYMEIMATLLIGDEISVKLLREGKSVDLKIVVGERGR